jgi:hypothetical protein
MQIGADPYQITMGTLGGYVLVYDIRYNLTTSVYKHHMSYPILAMATSKNKDQSYPTTLVSSGGPLYELSQLNLETGMVETLFRCHDQSVSSALNKNEIVTVPEFFKENCFKDHQLGTIRRESNFKQFNRSMASVRNHEQFAKLMSQAQQSIKNIDSYLFEASTQRYKLIHDAYRSPNACRSILIPRNLN